MRPKWCDAEPEKLPEAARPRFHRLYRFLASGKWQVKVMPDEKLGLIHGKAGVITLADGRRTAFLGSVNESQTAWRLNDELVWEGDSDEAVHWVQEELDTLWHSPFAVELSETIVQDIKRIAERSVIADLADWQRQPEPAAPVVEAPVYRKEVGLYAGSQRSGIMHNGVFTRLQRDPIKERVRRGQIRILIGTEAASEGLNLQRLGTLINLDLPWNPSRLEQRKGRIQRIGQLRDVVDIYNMRYAGSLEDRVHQLLSERLEGIASLFGQIPDILEDVWIDFALGEVEQAQRTIDAVPWQHPFKLRYHQIEQIDWKSCARVLDAETRRKALVTSWSK